MKTSAVHRLPSIHPLFLCHRRHRLPSADVQYSGRVLKRDLYTFLFHLPVYFSLNHTTETFAYIIVPRQPLFPKRRRVLLGTLGYKRACTSLALDIYCLASCMTAKQSYPRWTTATAPSSSAHALGSCTFSMGNHGNRRGNLTLTGTT